MSFDLLKSLKSFGKKFFEIEIEEGANEVDTMAAINDAAESFMASTNKKIADLQSVQAEYGKLNETVKELVTSNEVQQKLITEMSETILKIQTENKKEIAELKKGVAKELAKEETDEDDGFEGTLDDQPKGKDKVIKSTAFGKKPLNVK